jgi:hypothetical protein
MEFQQKEIILSRITLTKLFLYEVVIRKTRVRRVGFHAIIQRPPFYTTCFVTLKFILRYEEELLQPADAN